MNKYRVNVYDGEISAENVIARVRYNCNLDYWNGRNFQNGGVGLHKGITRLKDGRYVIMYGSDWQGTRDYAQVVSDETALKEILHSQNTELLNMKKYHSLKLMHDKIEIKEDLLEEE